MRMSCATLLLLAAGAVNVAAQQPAGVPAALAPDDAKVTVSGCLIRGDDGGGFLLADRAEAPDAAASRVVFWLDDEDELEGHAGHRVQVTGEIEGEIKKAEVEIEREDGFVKLEVKANGRKVVARFSEPPAAVGTSGTVTDDDVELDYVVRKIDVKSVRMLADNCR